MGKQQGETVMVPSRTWFNGERPEFVPPGHVWLEGDNATNSTDSRAYGPIPLAMIRGRVFYKVMVRLGMLTVEGVSAHNSERLVVVVSTCASSSNEEPFQQNHGLEPGPYSLVNARIAIRYTFTIVHPFLRNTILFGIGRQCPLQ